MFYNHLRQTVSDWNSLPERPKSLCPECQDELVAKRGETVRWHWSHLPSTSGERRGKRKCLCNESAWHVAMKEVYLNIPGWDVEVPVQIGTKTYRIDAAKLSDGHLREFVHSLSPDYLDKEDQITRNSPYKLAWIFDGDEFYSAHAVWTEKSKVTGNVGLRDLLKDRAYDLHSALRNTRVFFLSKLWKEWKSSKVSNIWYQDDDPRAVGIAQQMELMLQKILPNRKQVTIRERRYRKWCYSQWPSDEFYRTRYLYGG